MVFFPRYLVETDGFEKVYDVFASVKMWCAGAVLAHEDNGHVGEIDGEGLAHLRDAHGVLRDGRADDDDGKGYALLNDDGAVNGHGGASFLLK